MPGDYKIVGLGKIGCKMGLLDDSKKMEPYLINKKRGKLKEKFPKGL